jgi:spermidine synthase
VELAIDDHPRRQAGDPLQIGAVGLGVGTIALYGKPADSIRFFEINPDVDRLSRRYFTFLQDSKASVEVVLGDGRLSLERELEHREHRYDVLVVDAFSGDAIPVHLLTLEAMNTYWRALKDDGILALHVSNRYLNLTRVVSGLAPTFGKRLMRIRQEAGLGTFSSTWLLVTSNQPFLQYLERNVEDGADVPSEPPVVWSDAFSNLYEVLGEEPS